MKQYTTPEQTAKLIVLGVEKPKSRIDGEIEKILKAITQFGELKIPISNNCPAYSIGELIELLPDAICESKDGDYHYFLSIETDSLTWKVFYESEDEVTLCSTFGVELVDALCSMLTILKRQGAL